MDCGLWPIPVALPDGFECWDFLMANTGPQGCGMLGTDPQGRGILGAIPLGSGIPGVNPKGRGILGAEPQRRDMQGPVRHVAERCCLLGRWLGCSDIMGMRGHGATYVLMLCGCGGDCGGYGSGCGGSGGSSSGSSSGSGCGGGGSSTRLYL